jgi:hypothetical protein
MSDLNLPFPVHPAANLFPMLQGQAFDELVDDIRQNGLKEPVVFYKGELLDGRNRYRACLVLGIKPDAAEIDEDENFDPLKWVLSMNLHRRHLTTSERAMVAAKIRQGFDDEAKERQTRKPADSVVENLPQQKGKARDKAGDLLKVSGKSVDAATKVLKSGNDQVIAAVERGDMTVNAAVQKVVPKSKKPSRPKTKFIVVKKKEPLTKLDLFDLIGTARRSVATLKDEFGDEHKQALIGVLRDEIESLGITCNDNRQFFVELRKLFDEMDDFHRQQSLELWQEWLLLNAKKQGGSK